jgi:glycosyltransferase involved in cell wall biosynthesis
VKRDPQDFYLFFGQLTENKRADIAVDACLSLGRKLIVAGGGDARRLRRRVGTSGLVRFAGRVSDEEAVLLLSRARALLFPGIEDMGLVPVEAAAAGCPVIAFRKGGALDTVKEGVTGIFFDEQNADSLAAAMTRFEASEPGFADRAAFLSHARLFSKAAFQERVQRVLPPMSN